jgi:hypothetical protein
MANLNLSQFTTKTLVEDADWVFVWDTAGAISKKVSRNSLLNSGTLATSAPVTISQTWNDAAVAFTAFKVNATSTNSAAGSLLLDLQVGGVGQFSVNKVGVSSSTGGYTVPGILQMSTLASYGYHMAKDYCVTWGGNATLNGSIEVSLCRDGAANTLALRNGAAAQTFRVYNTFPGTGNNEYAEIAWVGNFLLIRPAASGTATVRGSVFGSGSSETYLDGSVTNFRSTSLIRWSINSSGHFVAGADNTYDIGASGASRPRNVYVGTSVNAAGIIIANSQVYRDNSSVIAFPSNGVVRLSNYLATDFSLLQLGGGTSSFPALKRSTTTLQARLADDSAFAPIQGKLTTDTDYTATTIVPTGFLTLYDAQGTAYRVPCVAA